MNSAVLLGRALSNPNPVRERMQAHDLEALYREHAAGLLGFLSVRLMDAAWAEDLLHDVFVAYLRQGTSARIDHPRAYLYRSAERLSLNALRDRAADHRKNAADASAFRAQPNADPLLALSVREALATLPQEERDVAGLRIFADLTFQEISDVLGVPLTTVFKRHARAMQALRAALDPEGGAA